MQRHTVTTRGLPTLASWKEWLGQCCPSSTTRPCLSQLLRNHLPRAGCTAQPRKRSYPGHDLVSRILFQIRLVGSVWDGSLAYRTQQRSHWKLHILGLKLRKHRDHTLRKQSRVLPRLLQILGVPHIAALVVLHIRHCSWMFRFQL